MNKNEELVDRITFLEDMDRDEVSRVLKSAVKEALKEWLDEKILTFGKWSLMTVTAAALAAVVYFILALNGWKHDA